MFESNQHYPASWYAASSIAQQTERPALQQDMDVDVLVVGAGFTGLYTAHNLADAGVNVAVIEASRVGWAASGRNGGQIILGFSCDMPPIEAALGLRRHRKSGSYCAVPQPISATKSATMLSTVNWQPAICGPRYYGSASNCCPTGRNMRHGIMVMKRWSSCHARPCHSTWARNAMSPG
jgi:hypothetical protein